MNRAELVKLTRAQQRYAAKLLTKIYSNRFGDSTAEDAKTSVGALEQMTRYMIDGREPYAMASLLDVLLQQFPIECLCEELRDHPLMSAAMDRAHDRLMTRKVQRVSVQINGIEASPVFLPAEMAMSRRDAQHMARQLQAALDAGFEHGWIKLDRVRPMAANKASGGNP